MDLPDEVNSSFAHYQNWLTNAHHCVGQVSLTEMMCTMFGYDELSLNLNPTENYNEENIFLKTQI